MLLPQESRELLDKLIRETILVPLEIKDNVNYL